MQTASLSPTKAPLCNPQENNGPTQGNNDPAIDTDPGRVSRTELACYRLIQRLARRKGYAFARVEALAAMLAKSVRCVRYCLRRLLDLGWIERQFDGRHLFLRPLADLPEPDPTPRPRRPFSRPKIAALVAGLTPKSCRSDPYKKTDRRDNNRPPGNVVVSPAPTPLDPGVLRQAEAAVKAYAQRHAVRSMGALLTAAIKGKWTPPAPVSDPPSDRADRPVRIVRAPAGFALRRHEAPTDAQEPQRAVPGLAPVSAALAEILGRCEARRAGRAAVKRNPMNSAQPHEKRRRAT